MDLVIAAKTIVPLDLKVQAQIQSSIGINSLQDVVVELVKNSLDAHATKVQISLDFFRGHCEVEDDGEGIPPSELGEKGGVAKPFREPSVVQQLPCICAK